MNKQHLSRRQFLKLSGIAAIGTILAACQPTVPANNAVSSESGDASAGEQVEITMWHGWTGADNTEMLNLVLDQFNEDFGNDNGILLTPTALGWDELFSKLVVSAAAGNPPDVSMFHNSEVPEYIERGILIPIDDLLAEVEIDFEGVSDVVIEASKRDGQWYAVPGDLHPLGMYYNVDLVEAAGLDPSSPPNTQADFLDWAEKLTIRDGDGNATQFGVNFEVTGARPRWLWFSLLNQFGGTFLGEDGTSAVNSEASQKALQFWVDLKGHCPGG